MVVIEFLFSLEVSEHHTSRVTVATRDTTGDCETYFFFYGAIADGIINIRMEIISAAACGCSQHLRATLVCFGINQRLPKIESASMFSRRYGAKRELEESEKKNSQKKTNIIFICFVRIISNCPGRLRESCISCVERRTCFPCSPVRLFGVGFFFVFCFFWFSLEMHSHRCAPYRHLFALHVPCSARWTCSQKPLQLKSLFFAC